MNDNTKKKMTLELCFFLCFDDNEYLYAGVQNGKECWCGNVKPTTSAPKYECDVPCGGDTSQNCGAADRMNIYQRFVKIFQHDSSGGVFPQGFENALMSPDDTDAKHFSLLNQLETYRRDENEAFHFKICYFGDLDGHNKGVHGKRCNEWKQTSNPVTEGTITGYEPISIAFPANGNGNPWAGLGKSEQPSTLIDDTGSEATAWMAVGAFKFTSKDKIPGPWGSQVTRVELFVCPWDKECQTGGRYSQG